MGCVLCTHVDAGNDESDRVGGGNVGSELGQPVCVGRSILAPDHHRLCSKLPWKAYQETGLKSNSQNSTSAQLSVFPWPSLETCSSHSPSIFRNSPIDEGIWLLRRPKDRNNNRIGTMPRGYITHRWRESESSRTKIGRIVGLMWWRGS